MHTTPHIHSSVRLLPLSLFPFFVLLFSACATSKQQPLSPDPAALDKGQVWQLTRMQGRDLDRSKQNPTLVFNPEAGTLSGFAHCNNYLYKYALSPENSQPDGDYYALTLHSWAGGSLGCPEAVMNAEWRYLTLLDKATRLRVTATTVTLYQRNKEILYYELQ